MKSPKLVVEHVENLESLLALETEWRALEVRANLTLPFLGFDWATTWWQCFREDSWAIKDSLFTKAIRDHTGQLVAVAPMMLTTRPSVGPLRIREAQFFGADPNITEVRGMLCLPDYELDVHEALIADLHQTRDRWDWVQYSGVSVAGDVAGVIDLGHDIRWRRDISNFVLPLESSWEAQRAKLGRHIKKSVRQCYNAPKRDHHDLQFEVLTDREVMRPALADFFRLHTARANASGMNPHRDAFAAASSKEFLAEVCEQSADRGVSRIFRLRSGDQTIATRIGFVLGGSLYLYYSGFDTAWSRYSVATRVTTEAIKYAITEGLHEVNLSTGNDASKTRWGPREHVVREGFLQSDSRRSRAAFSSYQRASQWREASAVGRLGQRLIGRRSGPSSQP